MKLKKMQKVLLSTAVCFILTTSTLYAAADRKPVELNANTVEYDTQTGLITATGSVKMIQDGAVLTGASAQYNSKTQEGFVTGGVVVDKEDMHMTAAMIKTAGANHMIATGNVVAVKADKTLTGPQIDYYPDTSYAVIESDARVTMTDGTFTSDRMEAYLNENRLIGTGNVHIVSPPRNLDAVGDQAVYYGKDDGKVVLTGNAVATQNNNTLRSNKLTIYLAGGKADVTT
ncbi:lipopolysaccharide export system protein LptA [Propionispira arboris]|uniref:Lipopolysaccharide export system protein LptA n=2 Tax=Propionispira arboris TaxID=84035 RepID=A0A1H6U5G7_9FIRM|nr:lipopolysaccharide export system protein LptA [Propionispira arboris]